jgi:ABC-type polysaccharide/polyol phosphate transport system ATPase subunit
MSEIQSVPVIDGRGIAVEYRLSDYRYSGFKDFVMRKLEGEGKTRTFRALDGVNVELARGESLALIGHNGCGKSTLLKVIAGLITPKAGSIQTSGRIAPMIELGAGFDFELSGRENIELSCMLMGLSRAEVRDVLPGIIGFADLSQFIDAPLKNYSSGMVARLGFACATAIDPDILLVDEVLSVGDANFARKCLTKIEALRQRGTSVILVSHDMGAVQRFCNRALVLEEGKLRFSGDVCGAIRANEFIMLRRMQRGSVVTNQEDVIPQFTIHPVLSQDGRPCDQDPAVALDVARDFSIELDIVVEARDRIRDGLSFGIGFFSQGQLIAGFNNVDLGIADPAAQVREHGKLRIRYDIRGGTPNLWAGTMQVVVSVQDDNATRSLAFMEVASVQVRNTRLGHNPHGYMMSVADADIRFELIPRP